MKFISVMEGNNVIKCGVLIKNNQLIFILILIL